MFAATDLLSLVVACAPPASEDPCAHERALAGCLSPTTSDEHCAETSSSYFDTMDHGVELDGWPPWLKLTAYTREVIAATDTLLTLYPSTVPERDCRAFDAQPFGRCRVVFYCDDHEGKGCPIYEDFTFNDQGEITFIEAWSDLPELLSMDDGDPWAEAGVDRLSTKLPGLGNSEGRIDRASDSATVGSGDDFASLRSAVADESFSSDREKVQALLR